MTTVMSLPATRVWLVLMAVTLAAWSFAEYGPSARLATTFVMLIAAFKVRLVIAHFMELGWKPYPWRALLECWTIASTALILGGYWLAEG